MKLKFWLFGSIIIGLTLITGCRGISQAPFEVPRQARWGIYELNLKNQKTELIYSTPDQITGLRLSHRADKFVFSQKKSDAADKYEEIAKLNIDGSGYQKLTDNDYLDTYPVWSPDDSYIAYLSFLNTLDIYLMKASGSEIKKLYDSGSHDADLDWVKDKIVFTSKSSIWIMDQAGTKPIQVTHPPKAGKWGNANLPFGDYDPRLSPDGKKIVFERLEDDASPHGNYNLFTIQPDGTNETRLTNTGYSQGFASWSHSGEKIIYIVAAIGEAGKYDLYRINADGSDNQNITPKYFPENFLIHSAVFSGNDTKIYFIGEWWE